MTTSSPTVSVVIPTHNRVDMTARALRSVLTQTYSDFEVIVVDDASTDETADSVRQLTDPRVSLLRHETNRGAAAARNTGLASARGAYVAFLDSDDEWLPKKLELQVERFAQNLYGFTKLGAVVGRYLRGGSLRVRSRSPFRGNVYPRLFKHWGGYFLSTMLCRKVCLEQVGGFDENVPALQWWDLCVRIAEHWEFDDVELPLSIQHDHAGPRIRTADRVAEAHTVFLEKVQGPQPSALS